MSKKLWRKTGLAMAALALLSACGGERDLPNYPGMPSYDPNQNNIYQPKPDTHGYNPNQPAGAKGTTFVTMRNVFLRVDPEIGVLIRQLEGDLQPKRQGDPVIYDDIRSFTTNIYRAQLVIDSANITRLKNKYVFNYPESPLKEINVQFTAGRIRMSGKMKQITWVPFEMEGTATTTPDGMILMVPDSIKVLGIPIGLQTSKLLKLAADRGVRLYGNNIILNPAQLFPPPAISGRVVGVNVQQDSMVLTFDSPRRAMPRVLPDPKVQNYMHVYGGEVLIMNELQRGAELQMVDMDPANPFDFFMAEYRSHLKAGYVKVVNDQGSLITLMPDYTKISSTRLWEGYPGGPPVLRSMNSGSGNPLADFMPATEHWKQLR
jgi:hypothetical protein